MAQAYDFLSEWFEVLNDDCDYALWSQYFIEGLSRLGAGKNGLELGCGSGAFCRALAKRGYRMTGADISAPMLSKGASLAREEGLYIEFVLADAVRLKTPVKYDFILSPNDCYNYIPPKKLPSALKSAAGALKDGGILWLDISSAYKLREKVANTVSCDDRDDITYLGFNTLFPDRSETEVTLFIREADGKYTRRDETHVRYIHETENMITALQTAGFEILLVEGHLGEPPEQSERINFICRKAKS